MGYKAAVVTVIAPSADTLRVTLERALRELPPSLIVGELVTPSVTSIKPDALRQLPALGERDVFRALPFVPSVSQPNDIIGRVHLAGGASDEHGVTLNGHPLQAPFHVLQVFGAFNPASLERMDVRLGQMSASAFDRITGSVELTTRRADSAKARELQVSVVSTSAVVVQPKWLGLADVMISGRSSYIDAIIRGLGIEDKNGGDDLRFPTYRDATMTIGRRGHNWALTSTYFYTRDYLPSSGGNITERPNSGEKMLGLQGWHVRGPWRAEVRASVSAADARESRTQIVANDSSKADPLFVDVAQQRVSAGGALAYKGNAWDNTLGIQFDGRRNRNAWSLFNPSDRIYRGAPPSANRQEQQNSLAVFGESSRDFQHFDLTLGLRVVNVGPTTHLLPRLTILTELLGLVPVSISLERRAQFDAIASEPIEGNIFPPTYLLTRPRRADVATLGTVLRRTRERSVLQATATLFARRNADGLVSESEPLFRRGDREMIDTSAPRFKRVAGRALGAAIAIDWKSAAGWMLQGGYTLQRSVDSRSGSLAPVPWDATNQLVAIAAVPLSTRWRVTIAQQYRSGNAIAPIAYRLLEPTFTGVGYGDRFVEGKAFAARAPGYYRTDVGIQRQWFSGRRDWIFSFQVINVLNRTNGVDFTGSRILFCAQGAPFGCESNGARQRSLPILPSLGLEVRW